MNPDFEALLVELNEAEARYLVVGAYALALHARPRATGDLDIWVESTAENAARVYRALKAFGAPLGDLTVADLSSPDLVFQIGVPPRRIDVLTSLSGLSFERAYVGRVQGSLGRTACTYIGREDLIVNKRAVGRPRDLADLDDLGAS